VCHYYTALLPLLLLLLLLLPAAATAVLTADCLTRPGVGSRMLTAAVCSAASVPRNSNLAVAADS
jgi:hypothetical protein